MQENPNQTSEKDALNFSTFVAAQEDGQLHADLTDAVNEIVAQLNNAAMEHGGTHVAGLTLSLGFRIDGGTIEVKAAIATKLPKENRPRSIFWSTPKNHLTSKNPKQIDMFRDVNAREEVRTIAPTA